MRDFEELTNLKLDAHESVGLPLTDSDSEPTIDELTAEEIKRDYSAVIADLREKSRQLSGKVDFNENVPDISLEVRIDASDTPDMLKRADALFEGARYLEFVGKYQTLKDVSFFSETARREERREVKAGARLYRGDIQAFPYLTAVRQELRSQLDTIEKQIAKQTDANQHFEWHKPEVNPELLKERNTLRLAMSALQKITWYNDQQRNRR